MTRNKTIIKKEIQAIEELIISDEYHLLRFEEEQSYISYQLERLRLYIKHLLIKESDND